MIDKIQLRKIKFDVLEMVTQSDLVSRIKKIIENKDEYKDDLEYPRELLREANLDISLNSIDEIVEAFNKFVSDMDDLNSLEHYSILEYIDNVNLATSVSNSSEEDVATAQQKLRYFLSQMEQIMYLQSKLLDSVPRVMDTDDKGNIIDIATNNRLFEARDYMKGREPQNETDIYSWALEFMADFLINNQKKMISKLDFDDDGFFVTGDGKDLFDDEEKEMIENRVDLWIQSFYTNIDEDIEDSEQNKIDDNDTHEENIDIIDDVAISKKEISKESKERMSRLKDTLKSSSRVIRK